MENRRGRKIAVDLLACLGAGFILLLVAILIVPRFIDRGSMGDNLRIEVSKLVKGVFELQAHRSLAFPVTARVACRCDVKYSAANISLDTGDRRLP
jgi:hypothetical protein